MSRSVVKGHSRLCRAIARVVLCAFLQAIAVEGAPPGQKVPNTQGAPSIPELEKKIPKLMAAAMIPGLSIALISDGQIAWHKGYEAYVTQGNKELAIRYYRKSLELNPDNTNGRGKLKELESGK